MKEFFILVPSDSPTGPIKGAYALANVLVEYCKVSFVTLKQGQGAQAHLDDRVKRICLPDLAKSFLTRVKIYRSILRRAGGRNRVVSISMCFSADLVNGLCIKEAVTCASIRGNLPANYLHDFGGIGVPLAWLHLFSLRRHDFVVAMNHVMAAQISHFIGYHPSVIGNFIDESPLEIWRSKATVNRFAHLVFLGALTKRKQPSLFVRSLGELVERGLDIRATIIGAGPEYMKVHKEIKRLGLEGRVELSGFLSEPAEILSKADVMVLPSLSEGISRAALEALFLGIPIVMRATDGNSELISDSVNGALFMEDGDLPDAILRALKIVSHHEYKKQLLPDSFRQKVAGNTYFELLKG